MSGPDIKELMRMAQEMQKSMKEVHDELSSQEFVGKSGSGLVTLVMTGEHRMKKLILDPKVGKEDLEVIADLVVAAHNAVIREIDKASEKRMLDLTKKLGIPGIEGRERREE
jgi:nucleoid-associated protein EbfC